MVKFKNCSVITPDLVVCVSMIRSCNMLVSFVNSDKWSGPRKLNWKYLFQLRIYHSVVLEWAEWEHIMEKHHSIHSYIKNHAWSRAWTRSLNICHRECIIWTIFVKQFWDFYIIFLSVPGIHRIQIGRLACYHSCWKNDTAYQHDTLVIWHYSVWALPHHFFIQNISRYNDYDWLWMVEGLKLNRNHTICNLIFNSKMLWNLIIFHSFSLSPFFLFHRKHLVC